MLKDRLRRLRLQKDLTQTQLAEATGVSRQTINYIERGRTTNPASGIVAKLAAALDTTMEELMGVEVPKVPAPVRSLNQDQRRVLLGAIAGKHFPPIPGELKQLAEIRRAAIAGGMSREEFDEWFRRATAEDVREELLPEDSISLEEELVGYK